MAYLGLARKWRPQTFDDLVGQAHISRTISNAIKTGRVSQGYLFTGTRGIGKTSAARIFAKALRCPQAGTTGVPCNKCSDCQEISDGRSVDVLEIDGASNNGVDAVREIRESAKYLPSNGKNKIYIIDEVHMLTTQAFNALLKTLEEPPAHVIFIFATTDPQKIPATVLSRCQRFDFKRVSQKDLTARLKFICESEKVTINADALATLAREAEGSMRDAVSLLDQILAVGGEKITGETVTEALGLVDKQTVLDCVTGILKRKPLAAVEAVGRVYLHGFDLKQFGREILRCLRQIMVARLVEQNSAGDLNTYMDLSDVDLADLKSLVHERSLDDLDMLFRLLNHGLEDVARSAIPKMVMDILVIKMASSEELISLADLKGAGDLGMSGGSGSNVSGGTSGVEKKITVAVASVSAPIQVQAPVQAAAAVPTPGPVAPVQPARSRTSEVMAALLAPSPKEEKPAAKIAAKPNGSSAAQATEDSVKTPLDAPRELHDAASWIKTVDAIKAQKPLVGSILTHLSFEGVADSGGTFVITLGYSKDHSYFREQLQSPAYTELLKQLLKNHLGRAVRLDYIEVLSSRSIENVEQERKKNLAAERRKTVLESETMRATQQLLGAKLEKLDISTTETL